MRAEHQAKQATATEQEIENGALADKRLELAQRTWQQCSSAKNRLKAPISSLEINAMKQIKYCIKQG